MLNLNKRVHKEHWPCSAINYKGHEIINIIHVGIWYIFPSVYIIDTCNKYRVALGEESTYMYINLVAPYINEL